MSAYRVFTPDMEYPEGVTELQATKISFAVEMRMFACELEWLMEHDCESGWAEKAKAAIDAGEITASELVEAAFYGFYNEDIDFDRYFAYALESLI